jgi:hypothetical protein
MSVSVLPGWSGRGSTAAHRFGPALARQARRNRFGGEGIGGIVVGSGRAGDKGLAAPADGGPWW